MARYKACDVGGRDKPRCGVVLRVVGGLVLFGIAAVVTLFTISRLLAPPVGPVPGWGAYVCLSKGRWSCRMVIPRWTSQTYTVTPKTTIPSVPSWSRYGLIACAGIHNCELRL